MGRDARDRRRHAGRGLATPWRSRLNPAAPDWAIGHASLARDLQTLAAYRFIDHIGSASVPALPNTSPHSPLSQVSAGATCPRRRMGAGVISAVINPPTTLSAGVDNRTAQTILRRTPSYRQANILIGQRGRTHPRHVMRCSTTVFGPSPRLAPPGSLSNLELRAVSRKTKKSAKKSRHLSGHRVPEAKL